MKKLIFGILIISLVLFGCISSEIQGENGTAGNVIDTTGNTGNLDGTSVNSNTVVIPISELSTTAKKYSYTFEGVKIIYFAVKGTEGVVRTAFDACTACYGNKKGYRQEGNDMVCNNCGIHFNIDSLGKTNMGGGCWPVYLPNEQDGDSIIIKKVDIEKGKYLFS